MSITSTAFNLSIASNVTSDFGSWQQLFPGLQVNLPGGVVYLGVRSVTSGTPDTMDLNAGGLLQPDNAVATFATVKVVAVRNKSGTATLTVGGGTNAVPGISFKVPPGGVAVILASATPYTVTASTGDILQVTADTGTASYDVMVVGT